MTSRCGVGALSTRSRSPSDRSDGWEGKAPSIRAGEARRCATVRAGSSTTPCRALRAGEPTSDTGPSLSSASSAVITRRCEPVPCRLTRHSTERPAQPEPVSADSSDGTVRTSGPGSATSSTTIVHRSGERAAAAQARALPATRTDGAGGPGSRTSTAGPGAGHGRTSTGAVRPSQGATAPHAVRRSSATASTSSTSDPRTSHPARACVPPPALTTKRTVAGPQTRASTPSSLSMAHGGWSLPTGPTWVMSRYRWTGSGMRASGGRAPEWCRRPSDDR